MEMTEINRLKELQDCDLAIHRMKHRLDAIPAAIGTREEASAREREQQAALEQATKKKEVLQKETELEIASREAEIRKRQARLVEVKTNKDYTALMTEIGHLKKEVSDLEERALLLMDEVNEERRKNRQAAQAFAERERTVARECEEMRREAEIIREKTRREETRRPVLARAIGAETLAIYERIQKSMRNGLAVAAVTRGHCSGCSMRIATSALDGLQRGQRVSCEHCTRILYLDFDA